MSLVLFRNGKVFDGLAAESRDGFEVLIENDRIKEVSDTPISVADARIVVAWARSWTKARMSSSTQSNSKMPSRSW